MTQLNENNNDEGLVSAFVLQHIEDLVREKGIIDFKIQIKAGSLKGDNYLGIIAKSLVSGKDKDGQDVVLNLIVKSAPKQEAFRNLAPIRLAYEREIYMYSTVLPKFIQFQTEKSVQDPFNSVATCLKTTFQDKDEALIMEDMKALGYSLENRMEPLTIGHVKLVITELAKLHAISFALKDQDPTLMRHFEEELKKNFMESMDFEMFEKHSDMQYDKIEKILNGPDNTRLLEKFQEFRKTIMRDFRQLISAQEAGKAAIIRHGDCWTNNFLFAYESENVSKVPSKICFLDWQLSHVGSPVLDLLYFMFSCTDKTLRDAHYDELMHLYYDTAKKQTAEMGTDIEKFFTFNDMQEHLKKFGRYGLAVAIMIVPLISSESDEVPDFNEICENIDLLEKFDFTSRHAEKIDTRLREVIRHLIDWEYL